MDMIMRLSGSIAYECIRHALGLLFAFCGHAMIRLIPIFAGE